MPGPVSPGDDNPGYRPGGPQRRTTWLWISLAVAVVIIVLLSAVVITQLKKDGLLPALHALLSRLQREILCERCRRRAASECSALTRVLSMLDRRGGSGGAFGPRHHGSR